MRLQVEQLEPRNVLSQVVAIDVGDGVQFALLDDAGEYVEDVVLLKPVVQATVILAGQAYPTGYQPPDPAIVDVLLSDVELGEEQP